MNKKIFAVLLIVMIAGVGVWNWQRSETLKQVQSDNGALRGNIEVSKKPVVKIGASLPLSGDMAIAGKTMKSAMELALKDIALEKELSYDYKLIFEDDQYTPKHAIINFNKLNSVDKVDALVSFWGNIGTLASNFAEKNKLLHLSCAFSDRVGKGFYNFNHATKPVTHIENMIRFYQDNSVKNLGIIRYNSLEVDEFMRVLKQKLSDSNIKVVEDMVVNPGEKDFRIGLLKMKNLHPDMLLIQMISPSAEILSKQLKEIGLNDIQITNLNDLSFVPEYYEKAIIFTEETGNSHFVERFKAFSGMNVMPCTANIYDNIRLIVEAFETSKKIKKDKPDSKEIINNILNNQNFKTVMSKIEIDKEGNINSPSVIKQIKAGKLETY